MSSTSISSTEPESRVHVELGPRSYVVQVVSGRQNAFAAFARSALDATWAGRSCRRALLVTDRNVERYGRSLSRPWKVSGSPRRLPYSQPVRGPSRSTALADLYDELVRIRADRHTVVVALGEVIGDLAGYVAASCARGLPLLMVPTTLLAQVDSSVGGKVGVNHPRAKNIIGAFTSRSASGSTLSP